MLDAAIVDCFACPRLVAWREEAARDQGRPVPRRDLLGAAGPGLRRSAARGSWSSGSRRRRTAATAPGGCSRATSPASSCGGRSTRRASRPADVSRRADDGLTLHGPADRRGRPVRAAGQQADARGAATVPAVPRPRAPAAARACGWSCALGAIGWDAALRTARGARPSTSPRPQPRFGHGAEAAARAVHAARHATTRASRTRSPASSPSRCSSRSSRAPASSPGSAGSPTGRPATSRTLVVPWRRSATTTRSSASSAAPSDADDQARVPQARPAVAPRRQHGARRAGAVQGDQRGLPGPVRSAAPPGLRHVRAGRRRRRRGGGVRGRGFGGFSRHLRRVLRRRRWPARARRARPQTGADLRYDLRITFEEAVLGTEKEIEFPVLGRCETCSGTRRRARARSPIECPQCKGRGEVRSVRQTMLGQMVNVSHVPALPGRGQDRRDAVRHVPAARAGPSAAGRCASRSRRASTRATRSASRTRARPGRAAGRRAACTSRSTSRRTRRSAARARSCSTRPTSRSSRRRWARRSTVPTVEGDEEVEIKPGTQPGHRDPAARPRRAAPPPAARPRRPPRPRQRRRAHEAVEEAARAARGRTPTEVGRARRARAGERRASGERGCATPSVTAIRRGIDARAVGRRHVAGARGRGGPRGGRGRVARSWRASRPAAPASSRRSSSSRRASPRASTRRGPPSSAPTCRRRRRRGARRGRAASTRRWGISRRSGCGRSATWPSRVVHEADWADAWKAHFPVLRVGRRLVDPADVAAPPRASRTTSSWRWTRAWRSGPASTPRPGCAWRRSRRWADDGERSTAAGRVLDVGSGSGHPRDRGAACWARRASLGVDTDPIAVEATAANAARNGLGGVIAARDGLAAPSGEPPFDLVLANLIASLLVRLADRAARPSCDPAGRCSRRGSSSTASRRSRRAFAARGLRRLRAAAPRATGSRSSWRRLSRGVAAYDQARRAPPHPPESSDADLFFPVILATHIALAVGLFLPSILLPFALRNRLATGGRVPRSPFVRVLLWLQAHGTLIVSGGLAITGVAHARRPRPAAAGAAVAAGGARDLRGQPARSRSSSSARTCAG